MDSLWMINLLWLAALTVIVLVVTLVMVLRVNSKLSQLLGRLQPTAGTGASTSGRIGDDPPPDGGNDPIGA